MIERSLIRDLGRIVPNGVSTNVSMRNLSRWRVGGPADFLVQPTGAEQIAALVKYLSANNIPWLVIGHTSNLLIGDAGIRGVVIQISSSFSEMRISGTSVWAQAGIWMPRFSSIVGRTGLTGLEHAVGIPGTLGGLVCMNGGSMRKGIGDNLNSCRCIDATGNQFELTRTECQFSYRESSIQKNGWIVADATFHMEKGNVETIRSEMLQILRSRRKKFPLKEPNCGSVFVSNPYMYERWGPPGAVIERCGLKGRRIGGAQISPLHANFIVNKDNATANDILALIHEVRETTYRVTDCDLVCEVRYVQQNCAVKPAHEVIVSPNN